MKRREGLSRCTIVTAGRNAWLSRDGRPPSRGLDLHPTLRRAGAIGAVLSLRYEALEVHPGAGFKERNRVGEILTSDVQALKAEQTGVAEKAATCWWVAVYSADAHSLLRGIARDPTSFTKRIGAVP
jgi:hypothetical protein